MPLPTFLVLGVAKAGTTSLHHYLAQHPQIGMSQRKEPHFFAYGEAPLPLFIGPGADRIPERIVTTFDGYQALFSGTAQTIAYGETSTTNIMPRACARIQHYVPTAKLIVILRQPAERAYSQFLHLRRIGWEPIADFSAALAAEAERQQQQWQPVFLYTPPSYYYADLQRYFAAFAREQIRVYLYEEWQQEPLTVLQDLFRFIGVDAAFVPDMREQHNVASLPRSRQLQQWLYHLPPAIRRFRNWTPPQVRQWLRQGLQWSNRTKPPRLSPVVRNQLTARYRDDILQLQTLLQRDLTHWLTPSPSGPTHPE
ncbi:MAG: sulfotransferase [Caldilineaceae bacterium]|nr:sulfotransferase [Caldilineaceae bacterium]